MRAGCLQSRFSHVGRDSSDERFYLIFFLKCSDLGLATLFILTLGGALDLALPLSECVKVESHILQAGKVSCDDS